MSEAETRKIFIFQRKFRKLVHKINELLADKLHRFGHSNDIGVVTYIAGGCTEVDNSLCLRALNAVSIDMGHNVVSDELFSLGRNVIVDILGMSLQLINLLLSYIQSKLHFALCKCDPQSAPCFELEIG